VVLTKEVRLLFSCVRLYISATSSAPVLTAFAALVGQVGVKAELTGEPRLVFSRADPCSGECKECSWGSGAKWVGLPLRASACAEMLALSFMNSSLKAMAFNLFMVMNCTFL